MRKRVLITGFLIAALSLSACSKGAENKDTNNNGKNKTQTEQQENEVVLEDLGIKINPSKDFNKKENIQMLVIENENVSFSFMSTEDNKMIMEKSKNAKKEDADQITDLFIKKSRNLGCIAKIKAGESEKAFKDSQYSMFNHKEKVGALNGYEYYLLYSDKYDENDLSEAAKVELKEAANSIKDLKNNITIFDPVKNPVVKKEEKAEKQSMKGVINFNTKTLAGKDINSSIFKDHKITMINIWSTSCGPCIDEMPELQKLHEEAKKENVNVIGVVADTPDEDNELLAKDITKKQGAKFDNIIPDEKLSKWILDNVKAAPTTIFVDKDGNIIADALIGAQNKDAYMKNIKEVLQSVDK